MLIVFKLFVMSIESNILEQTTETSHEGNYEFFKDDLERSQLFEYCKAVAEYLKEQEIPNILIIDRSARPIYIGIKDYFQAKYPKQEKPGIYFINPKGLLPEEKLTPQDITEIAEANRLSVDIEEGPDEVKTEKEIEEEFQEIYKHLIKDKTNPVLVFDTCIHSGQSITSVKDILEKNGFTEVLTGTVNPTQPDSKVKSDFYISPTISDKYCHPFDRDGMIEKTFEHVYSKGTGDLKKRERAIRLRKEIKRIVQEYLADEPL